MEPRFKSDFKKYAFLPIDHPELHEFYCKLRDTTWNVNEVQFKEDQNDWDSDDPEIQPIKDMLKIVLALFAQADGIVSDNLTYFKQETSDLKENCHFYAAQEYNETIHNEAYSKNITALITKENERKIMFNAIENFESIQMIAEWTFKFMDPTIPLMERLIAFSCIEGIVFQSAFAMIYFIKKLGLFKATTKLNEWISRDEAEHTDYAVTLYSVYTNKLKKYDRVSNKRIHQIIKSAVNLNIAFIKDALNEEIDLEPEDMIKYIKCTADKLAEGFGAPRIYDEENPFMWMAVISLPNKSNFFETRPTEYGAPTGEMTYKNLDTLSF